MCPAPRSPRYNAPACHDAARCPVAHPPPPHTHTHHRTLGPLRHLQKAACSPCSRLPHHNPAPPSRPSLPGRLCFKDHQDLHQDPKSVQANMASDTSGCRKTTTQRCSHVCHIGVPSCTSHAPAGCLASGQLATTTSQLMRVPCMLCHLGAHLHSHKWSILCNAVVGCTTACAHQPACMTTQPQAVVVSAEHPKARSGMVLHTGVYSQHSPLHDGARWCTMAAPCLTLTRVQFPTISTMQPVVPLLPLPPSPAPLPLVPLSPIPSAPPTPRPASGRPHPAPPSKATTRARAAAALTMNQPMLAPTSTMSGVEA
jgi:hypothetical protein